MTAELRADNRTDVESGEKLAVESSVSCAQSRPEPASIIATTNTNVASFIAVCLIVCSWGVFFLLSGTETQQFLVAEQKSFRKPTFLLTNKRFESPARFLFRTDLPRCLNQ